jgi:hypothetical protein
VATNAPAQAFAYAGHGQRITAGGATDTLVVLVVGSNGAPVSGLAVTWTGDAAGTLTESATVTDANGRAQAIFAAGTRAGAARVTAAASGVEPVAFEIAIDPASPARLRAMAPLADTVAFGQAFTGGGVQVVDQYGNAVSNVEFSTSFFDAEQTLISTGMSQSDAQGIARVPFAIAPSAAGDYTLRFESPSLSFQYSITVLAPVDSSSTSSLKRVRP